MARSASRSGGEEEEEERSLGWWVARIRVDDDVDHSIAGETTWPKWAETHSLLWTSPWTGATGKSRAAFAPIELTVKLT